MFDLDSNNLMLRKDGEFFDAVTEQPLHKNAFHDEFEVVKYVGCKWMLIDMFILLIYKIIYQLVYCKLYGV